MGTLAVLGSGAHHRLWLTAEVVGRTRVRWSAAQLSNDTALNDLSDMVGVCAGLGGGEGSRGRGGVIQAVQIQPMALR